MTDTNAARSDVGSALVAVLMIILGGMSIWDTTTYADFDSAVFPRAVAIGLIGFSVVYLLGWLLGRTAPAAPAEPGSWPRRILLVAAMVAAALAMPWFGFVLTALLCFLVLLVIAMHDPWTPFRLGVYPLVGAAVVGAFYLLFAKVLKVPLPQGFFWQ